MGVGVGLGWVLEHSTNVSVSVGVGLGMGVRARYARDLSTPLLVVKICLHISFVETYNCMQACVYVRKPYRAMYLCGTHLHTCIIERMHDLATQTYTHA